MKQQGESPILISERERAGLRVDMRFIKHGLLALLMVAGTEGRSEQMTIEDILNGYDEHRFTAEELTRRYLQRIEQFESSYNAFTFMNRDALEDARDIDRRRKNGEALGPLAGVPLVIKESMDIVGYPSTFGWTHTSAKSGGVELLPKKNATVVQRLIDADAIILGKTNIPAFSDSGTRAAASWAGPTYNVVNRKLAPGGSSSGTATAVAAGFAAAGLAEETGGSIQNPAAAQSLVGIVPTFSLVPNSGVAPLGASTLDVMGPIAKTVYDAALLLDVIAGSSRDDPKTSASDRHIPVGGYTSLLDKEALRGKRIGLYGAGWNTAELTNETRVLYERSVKELEDRGATVIEDPFVGSGFAGLAEKVDGSYDPRGLESLAYDLNLYLNGLGVDSLAEFEQMLPVSPFAEGEILNWYVEYVPGLQASIDDPQSPPDLGSFLEARQAYRDTFDAVLKKHNLDALVLPHAIAPLPDLDSEEDIRETTVTAINIGALPAVTVPAGRYENSGSPFSLIFVGRPFSEAELLALAYDYEQATRHRIVPYLDGN